MNQLPCSCWVWAVHLSPRAGLDFGYVKHPFQPNSGRKKMSDFVRRRRWIRTRVPLELSAQPRATAIAADSASWDVEALAAGQEPGVAGREAAEADVAVLAPPAAEGRETVDSAATEATLAAPDEALAEADEAPGASAAEGVPPGAALQETAEQSAGQPAAPAAEPAPGHSPTSEQRPMADALESIFAQVCVHHRCPVFNRPLGGTVDFCTAQQHASDSCLSRACSKRGLCAVQQCNYA